MVPNCGADGSHYGGRLEGIRPTIVPASVLAYEDALVDNRIYTARPIHLNIRQLFVLGNHSTLPIYPGNHGHASQGASEGAKLEAANRFILLGGYDLLGEISCHVSKCTCSLDKSRLPGASTAIPLPSQCGYPLVSGTGLDSGGMTTSPLIAGKCKRCCSIFLWISIFSYGQYLASAVEMGANFCLGG